MSVGPIAPLPAAAGVQPIAATTAPSATAAVSAQAESPVVAEVATEVMAGPEAALSAMISDAVTQQTSLAPLFADIAAAMSSPSLPPEARATMAAILASQTPLDETTSAAQLRAAAQSSGVFLEAGLAAEVQGEPSASANVQTDLKALLLKLVSDLAPPPEPGPSAPGAAPSPTAAAPSGNAAPPAQATAAAEDTPNATPPAAGAAQPTGAAATSAQESAPVAQDAASTEPPPMASGAAVAISEMAARDLAAGDLAPTTQGAQPSAQGNPAAPARADATANSAQSAQAARPAPPVASLRATPQPPIAGGPTAGQPAVRAIVGPHDAPESLIQTLRQEAIGALARVQLSQAASVPRSDAALRWSFEAPIATPDGTAIGQFEIDRDGKGAAASKDETGPTWRARFSLDLSPSGPVHAEISLSGGRTRVVLMAEREDARLALASGQDALAAALAGENGGEAAVRVVSGAPRRPTPPAGQMLDKST
jgi:hypothetical protein